MNVEDLSKTLLEQEYFISKWYKYFEDNPDDVIIIDEKLGKKVTMKEIETLSGQVYSYLKNNNIGTEDVVMVCMPRSYHAIACVLGVWKAGAVLTIVEDTYSKERSHFIREDSNCKLFLNWDVFEEILNTNYEKGYVQPDLHDAAFIVYTSGTTGRPKGVVHEYGNIYVDVLSDNGGRSSTTSQYTFASQFHFIATLKIFLALFTGFFELHIISLETLTSIGKVRDYFEENKINICFLPPSIIKAIGRDLGSSMKYVFTGSEPANNLSIDGAKLINSYSMTECAFTIAQFEIDRPYSPCPVGKPNIDIFKIYILDDNGNEVNPGDVGEIAFENPFMRGYINLPEETKEAFKDGLFHTGDLGRFDDDGNLLLIGRSSDTIKINGTRMEPVEIESVLDRLREVNNSAVRAFQHNGTKVLVCYYEENEPITEEGIKTGRIFLGNRIPEVCIPRFWVKVDKLPRNVNGKIDRKKLEEPDYVKQLLLEPPQNYLEEKLLEAAKRVLPDFDFGVTDNLYSIGMNSLNAMHFVSEIGKYDSRIGVSDVLRHKNIRDIINSPKEIAWFYKDYKSDKPTIVLSAGIIAISALEFSCEVFYKYFNILVIEPFVNHISAVIGEYNFDLLIKYYADLIEEKVPDTDNVRGFAGFSFGGVISVSLASEWDKRFNKQCAVFMGDTLVNFISGKNTFMPLTTDNAFFKIVAGNKDEYEDTEVGQESDEMILNNINSIIKLLNSMAKNERYDGKVFYFDAKQGYEELVEEYKLAIIKLLYKNIKIFEFPNHAHNDIYLSQDMMEVYNKFIADELKMNSN